MPDSLEFIFQRANSALITRDFKYAEQLLINALKRNPNVTDPYRQKIEDLLARIYVDAGDLPRALEAYLRLYAQKPADTEIMNNLGRIYRHLERFDDALAILEKAKDIGGPTDEVLYNLAKTHKRLHNYEKAAEYFSLAIELKPDHAHAYDRLGNLYVLTGETDKAIEVYKDGLRVDANHPYLNFHLAGVLRKEKRFEEAIVYYNSALRSNPSWSEALYDIANTYLQIDKLDDALHTYRSLLRVAGESAPIYTELGQLFEKKRLDAEAEQYYYDALTLDSGYAPAALALAGLLGKRKAYKESLPVVLTAEADPANAQNAALRLKAIQLAIYTKDYAKAHELIQKQSKQDADDINLLKLQGQLSALMGETEEAERIFEKILNTAPSAIEFRRELAAQYLLAHRYEDAKKELELFLKQRPLDIEALMTLGQTYEALNNPKAAYAAYQKILEQEPENIHARAALSHLFQKYGNTIEALKAADEMLNLQSTSSNQDMLDGLAETLDLYERAAESYMTDPLLKKNLETLKSEDSDLYIPQTELEMNTAQYSIFPLFEETAEDASDTPFDLLAEGAEEDRADDEESGVFENIQLRLGEGNVPVPPPNISAAAPEQYAVPSFQSLNLVPPAFETQSVSVPGQTDSGTAQGSTPFISSQVEELHLQPNYEEIEPAFDPAELSKILAKTPKPSGNRVRTKAVQHRLDYLHTHDTAVDFLQDVESSLVQKLDDKRYDQVIETLAEKIADNLADKGYIPVKTDSGSVPDAALPEDAALEDLEENAAPVLTDDTAPVIAEETAAETIEELSAEPPAEPSVLQAPGSQDTEAEVSVEVYEEDDFVEDGEYVAYDEVPKQFLEQTDDIPEVQDAVDAQAVSAQPAELFMPDEDEQNLLWCHAKRKLKDMPVLEEYLQSADAEKLAGLFLYLRDLLAFLPHGKREDFLHSGERMLTYYIISRLSGDIGLKERAGLFSAAANGMSGQALEHEKSLIELLEYLRGLTASLPDQELSERCRKELSRLIADLSSVVPDTADGL
ncbi:MAG: tetratricopeptide repeat protein [Treponema sp.]